MKKDSLKMKLETMKCKKCGKKVEIFELCAGENKIKYAPCKACGCDNLIHCLPWNRGPAEVDMSIQEEIIEYLSDLYNLEDLLQDFGSLMLSFIRLLKKAGYADKDIQRFLTSAAYGTRFSGAKTGVENGETYLLGCGQDVPRVLPNRGDWNEWMLLRPRAV
jgi:hypothetical protein